MKKMSLLGIGGKMALVGVAYFLVAVVLTWGFPKIFLIDFVPRSWLIKIGVLLLAIGIPMLVISASTVSIAFRKGKLLTRGIYSLSRNPLYAAWILFIIPGASLFFDSWIILGTPLATYLCFKAFIKEEVAYLQAEFGQDFLDYEARVNELLPMPKLFKGKITRSKK